MTARRHGEWRAMRGAMRRCPGYFDRMKAFLFILLILSILSILSDGCSLSHH
jgi:hypothetical protein